MLHVQEVPGGLDGAKAAVCHMLPKYPGILGAGVFVPLAIQEQYWNGDLPCGLEVALAVAIEDLADVVVHLPVFMFGQSADMPIVEALEQRRQVFADGAVDQIPNAVAVEVAEVVNTAFQVVAHGRIDHWGE